MLKNQNPVLVTILAIVLVVGFSYLLESFVILPSYGTWTSSQNKLNQEKQKVEQIKNNVDSLKSLDKNKIAQIRNFVDILIPDQFDSFHFASLNEVVSKAAGVTITAVSISQGAGGSTTSAGKGQTNQTSPASATVTYASDFDSLLRLIRYWQVADRFVAASTITITGQAGAKQLTYTLSYQLPVSATTSPATVDEKVVLTATQTAALEKLRDSILYTATPSANPVGKDNPFQ